MTSILSRKKERAWKDSNLRHTAPETVALSPELQAHKEVPPGNVTVRLAPLQRAKAVCYRRES